MGNLIRLLASFQHLQNYYIFEHLFTSGSKGTGANTSDGNSASPRRGDEADQRKSMFRGENESKTMRVFA